MTRVPPLLRTVLIIAATVLVTEWAHVQFGSPHRVDLPAVDSLSDTIGLETDVTEAEFEIYVRALEAMHANHSLTVEKAADEEGLSLEEFRDVERRVQLDDLLVERTRESLRRKAESVWDSRRADVAPRTPDDAPEL